jgi:hypothetical protein
MPDSNPRVLAESRSPKELSAHARLLAQSDRQTDQEELGKWLRSEEFMARLDSEEAYRGPSRKLRLWEVMKELRANPSPAARSVILTLTKSPTFLNNPARVDLLIETSAVVRPAPPELIAFWDDHCQPDDGFTHLTIEAIVENGSAPAMNLLEKKMADARHSDEDKKAWMVTSIMTHRNNLLLLQACERLLGGRLSEHLRPTLVEALYDYRPAEWFSPATLLASPDRRKATPEALAQLREMGQMALQTITLTETQKLAVRKTLEDIERLLGDGMNTAR